MSGLHERTAVELAALVRGGEVSCRAVVEAHLARIEATNGQVNAVTVVLAEPALAAADLADSARASGARGLEGPLHGVPFTVKEAFDCVGTATTYGVRALRDALPYVDAPAVARLKAAGAILLGRTNMSEMGLRLCTDNPLRGRTRNPWNPRLTVGGSSGGDAAAVATGMAPLGLGSDLGGSLRVPAHCCGVASLKPTTGRIPHAASLPPRDMAFAGQTMMAPGPMARSVADLRLALSVLAGRDIRDPRSVDAPLRGATPEERRVALVCELPDATISPDNLAAIRRAGELLAEAGWEVEETEPPEIARVGELWHKLIATDLSVLAPSMEPLLSPALYEHVVRMCRAAKLEEVSNSRIHTERSRLQRAWSGFFSEYPVVVGPNLTGAPWARDADLDPDNGLDLLARATRFILPANALGLPVVALPMGLASGLPVGFQIYADLWREDLCLVAAGIVERGVPMRVPVDPVT
jgi:amidase